MTESEQCCGICSKVFGELPEDGIGVTCDGACGKAFHPVCADRSMPFLVVSTAKVGLLRFCRSCRLEFEPEVLQTTIREMLCERVDSIDANIKQLSQVAALNSDPTAAGSREPLKDGTDLTADIESPSKAVGELPQSAPRSSIEETELCTDGGEIVEESKLQLSKKIWSNVFHYLNYINLIQVRLVCREWKQIVDDDRWLMEKFIYKFPRFICIDEDFEPGSMLPAATISFTNSEIVSIGSWWCSQISEMLVNLVFESCKINLVNLLEMLQRSPNLNSLKLGCGETLTYHSSVEKFSDLRLEKMESLELDYLKQNETGRVLGKAFPRLINFKLRFVFKQRHSGVIEMIKIMQSLEEISLPFLPDLTGLERRLKGVSIEISAIENEKTFYENLISLVQMQPYLEKFHLEITGPMYKYPDVCSLDMQETLGECLGKLRKLKHLSLRLSKYVAFVDDNDDYDYDSDDDYDDDEVSHINLQAISCLVDLEFFALEWTNQCYPSISLSETGNPNLKELHLSKISFRELGHFALREYIDKAPNLRIITLELCLLNSWSDLFDSHQLKKLHQMKLMYSRVSIVDCNSPLEYFAELRRLELWKFCMSEEFLSSLFRLCPRVEELQLCSMRNVSDSVVQVLCQNMKQLRKLTLFKCPITDAAVKCLTEHGQKLEQLTIMLCSYLSTEAKRQLKGANILMVKSD